MSLQNRWYLIRSEKNKIKKKNERNLIDSFFDLLTVFLTLDVVRALVVLYLIVMVVGIFTGTAGTIINLTTGLVGLAFFIVLFLFPFFIAIDAPESARIPKGPYWLLAALFASGILFAAVGTIGVPQSINFLEPVLCLEDYTLQSAQFTEHSNLPGDIVAVTTVPVCVKEGSEAPPIYPGPGETLGAITFFYMLYSLILLSVGYSINSLLLKSKYKNLRYLLIPGIFMVLLFTVLINPEFIKALVGIADVFIGPFRYIL